MLELNEICVRFGQKTVLERVSLHVPAGAHIAVMGASGVGKSTLLRMIAGLQQPSSGSVRVSADRCAMLFQQPRLLPWCSAAENVNCVLSDRRATMPQALEWLRRLGLADEAQSYPTALSGGMQQRVALARVLAYGGELVLLDEPFQGLDEQTKREAIALCRECLWDKTTILVTHSHQEAQALADTIYLLHKDGLQLEEAYE